MKNGSGQIQVLLVDDDELTREVLTLQMRGHGYLVETADSGEAAVSHLQQPGQRSPDAVLTDLLMPGLSGLELSRRLRVAADAAGSPDMLMLAMSASHPDENLRRGFDGFLLKPFTMRQLVQAIDLHAAEAPPDVANGISPEDSLDEAIYLRLAGSMPAAQLQQLYALCLDDAEALIQRMRFAAVAGDEPAFRKEAHTIKGGCGIVGAVELHRLSDAAEKHGIDPANHVASLNEMLTACERLRRILVARINRASL
jgi:CheY-like chemotaxis protein/HPt (histidine-containing phosphotransfer) domain-containing protein